MFMDIPAFKGRKSLDVLSSIWIAYKHKSENANGVEEFTAEKAAKIDEAAAPFLTRGKFIPLKNIRHILKSLGVEFKDLSIITHKKDGNKISKRKTENEIIASLAGNKVHIVASNSAAWVVINGISIDPVTGQEKDKATRRRINQIFTIEETSENGI